MIYLQTITMRSIDFIRDADARRFETHGCGLKAVFVKKPIFDDLLAQGMTVGGFGFIGYVDHIMIVCADKEPLHAIDERLTFVEL